MDSKQQILLIFVGAFFFTQIIATSEKLVCLEFCDQDDIHKHSKLNGWIRKERASPSDSISLTIALKLQNTDVLDERFWSVSDPKHNDYGKHLTLEQVTKIVSPSVNDRNTVLDWLSSYGITDISVPFMGDYIIANHISIEIAERLLNTQFYRFVHSGSNNNQIEMIRSNGKYYVSEKIANLIDFVGGVSRLPLVKSVRVRNNNNNNSNKRQFQEVTPVTIKQTFNIPPNIRGQAKNNSQAVAQFDVYAQYLNETDLHTFQSSYGLPTSSPTIVGYNDATNPGIEAMLDIEYIMGIAPGVDTWFVTTNGTADGGQEPFLAWIVAEKNNPNSPWVHSISYGDPENTVSLPYIDRVNQEFKIFGSMGRTISFSSGDDGTGCNNNGTSFVPNFPASSPFVTAVGGITYGNSNQLVGDTISSGGFSDYFGRPSYQQNAINTYLTSQRNNLPSNSYWNNSGRGIPDISSFSESVVIVVSGSSFEVGGTSCASPVISGIFSLSNDARLQKGKSPMGFMNIFLYDLLENHPDAFFDITIGNNDDCGNNGFPAAPGWDAITGVGAVNFQNFITYVMQAAK